ncbi:LON peptidase substrate-binding domain-containing protein [Azospirillum thermophilum]|uniref:Peptidase S16 n=1 Tax=Azospirillum thermophilum TaxID=2202148 RepID=A0A2S2CTH3_9PROT|nr:LON peptidase substrate-binding domain-containing protein [Azospirillum thermophilum]AWK87680.1 peptidase S16 [Azospirillum thermophilum]
MSRNPFDPTLDRLPRILPIFPLAGVLLLPRARLPLNVFEPRYLAMVEDAMGSGRMIGIIQPTDPASRDRNPPVYETGCAGRITSFAETDDGRFLITLTGVSRFVIHREMEGVRGYRRVVPAWDRYAADLDSDAGPAEGAVDRGRLLAGLKLYFQLQGLSCDWHAIETTPDERLVNSLAMICPFAPSEKQALLEAPDLTERGKLLIALIEMSILDGTGDCAPPRH